MRNTDQTIRRPCGLSSSTLDALAMASLVRRREVSPLELVDAAIARIEAQDATLNAVTHRLFDEARAAARGPLPDGPLRGVPYLVKDLHATIAGQPTSEGTRLAHGLARKQSSRIIERLLAAGVVLLGRTNTPEFGIMGITESRLHGPARNPWRTSHTPGGSSGGAGAAVAAGYVPAAHASDGGGSIRIPASHCGLVGLKPTRARTPFGPHAGEGWSGMTVEHALTRSVRDTAALLDAVCGPEAGAPYQVLPPERPYLDEVGRDPGRLRIAFTTRALLAGENAPACLEALQKTAAALESLGHHVEEAEPDLDRNGLRSAYFDLVCASVACDVNETATRAGRAARASDFEPSTWMLKRIGEAIPGADIERSRRLAQRTGFQVADFFTGFDLWLTPTCARPPARIGELYPARRDEWLMTILGATRSRLLLRAALDRLAADALVATPNTQLANLLGLPAISLPLHVDSDGLPIGTQMIAAFGREDLLIRVASQLEVAMPWISVAPATVDTGSNGSPLTSNRKRSQ